MTRKILKPLAAAALAAALFPAAGIAGGISYQSGGISESSDHNASYQGTYAPGDASGASIAGDTLLIRPASFVATVGGTGLFLLSLPLSILSNTVDESAHKLVVNPARYTFKRPLGHFSDDAEPDPNLR
jgi:hypothetical protein